MKQQRLNFCIFLTLLSICWQQGVNQEIMDQASLSEFGNEVQYVQLETSSELLFPRNANYKMLYTSKYFIYSVFDRVVVFQKTGEFVCQFLHEDTISSVPVPYCIDIEFDDSTETLFILGVAGEVTRGVYQFNLQKEYIIHISIDDNLMQLSWDNDNHLIALGAPFGGRQRSKEIDILGQEMPLSQIYYQDLMDHDMQLSSDANELIVGPVLEKTPRIIIVGSNVNRFFYDVRNNLVFKSPQEDKWDFQPLNEFKSYPAIHSIIQSGDNSLIQYWDDGKTKFCCLNQTTNSTSNGGFYLRRKVWRGGFRNDLDGGLPFWPQAKGPNGELVCLLDPFEIVRWGQGKLPFKGGRPAKMSEEFLDFASSLRIDQHPVLMIVKPKSD